MSNSRHARKGAPPPTAQPKKKRPSGSNRHRHQQDPSNLTSPSNGIALLELTDKLLKLSTAPYEQVAAKNLDNVADLGRVLEYVNALEMTEEAADHDGAGQKRFGADVLARFTDWLRAGGAKFDGVEIAAFGDDFELGLRALVEVPESTLVVAVPRNLMMTLESASSSELSKLLDTDLILSKMPNVALTMFLLLEKLKGADSFWSPYIEALPQRYRTILYFDLDDMKELQTSPTLEGVVKQYKNIVRQYAYFYRLIWTADDPACSILRKGFTFEAYRWAVSTIMTRQNTVPSEDGLHSINALIPLWDMCNHSSGTITTNYNPDLNRSECLALRNFKAGEQIFIFYGARSNAELFIHNGFVYEDNVHDGYCLYLGVSKMDPLKEKRKSLLNKLSIPEHGEFWLTNRSLPIDSELLAFLRVFNMSEEQLTKWIDDDNEKVRTLLEFERTFEESFEKKYWTFLVNRIKLMLASYKSTMEQDREVLAEIKSSPKKVLSIKMRLSEKKILNNVLKYAQDKVDNLTSHCNELPV